MEASTVAAREAATVMLVRDAPKLEVFMVRRHPESSFVPDSYVFPGGQVDDGDATDQVLERCIGADVAALDRRLGVPGAARFYVAALREAFEEAGVLVARERRGGMAMTPASELADDRRRLIAGTADIGDILDAHDVVLDIGALVPFARWVGPVGAPRRFDAWHFITRAPEGQVFVHDDHELVASAWVRPREMVDRARAGEVRVPYPTLQTLRALRDVTSADALLAAADECWTRPNPWRIVEPGRGWVLDLDLVTHGGPCRI